MRKRGDFADHAAMLFGRRPHGDNSACADIDIAVECPRANVVRWFDMIVTPEEAPPLLKSISFGSERPSQTSRRTSCRKARAL